MYDPDLRHCVIDGIGRVIANVHTKLPHIAEEAHAWIKWHSSTDEPADYYMHPGAFPLMLLPWWAEKQITGAHDLAFQTDLAWATGNFYYYTRIVDNLMDNHPTVEQRLLPTAGYFMFQFQQVYQTHFAPDHPFWAWCDATWSEFCDICAKDVRLIDIDEPAFIDIVSRKCCAGKIALGAVLYRHNRTDLLPAWMEWVDLYSCWHVLQEDLFDWKKDYELHTETYILSEAQRRKDPDEPLIVWLAREGFDWAEAKLDGWMDQLRMMGFQPAETRAFLDQRQAFFRSQRAAIDNGLKLIASLDALGREQANVLS